MDIIKISALGLTSILLISAIKKQEPAFAILIATTTGIIILSLIMPKLVTIMEIAQEIFDILDNEDKYLKILFKIIGISYIGHFSSQLCKDMGQANIGDKIELAAKIIIGVYTLPVIKNLMDMVIGLLP